jgi:protein-S-isoprenylcysteine O-methyltransferase Ste14
MAELGISGSDAGSVWRRIAGTRGYDYALRLAVACWFLALGIVFVRDIGDGIGAIAAAGLDALAAARLVSRFCLFAFFTLIAWLTLVRTRPLARAEGLQPRLSALAGCYLLYGLAFLPRNAELGVALHVVSALLLLLGNGLAVVILIRLGRSFSIMAEARGLVTDGPYRLVRHPLYLAEQIAIAGAFIQFASPSAALLVLVQLAFQLQRMRNEEAVLARAFPDYAAYARRTPRLVPGIWPGIWPGIRRVGRFVGRKGGSI